MSKKYFIFIIFFFFPTITNAQIIISEIAWMGTVTSHNDEWIELYNESDTNIDLEGWALGAQDGSPTIILSGVIFSKNTYLLERTDDTTVPNISSDLIYTGALKNSGEVLILKNNSVEVFRVDASSGWQGGDNTTKETMQFVNGVWETRPGTPKEFYVNINTNAEAVVETPIEELILEPTTEDIPETIVEEENNIKLDIKNKGMEEVLILQKETIEELKNVVVETKKDEQKGVETVSNTTEKETKKENKKQILNIDNQEAQVINTITIEKPKNPIIEILLLPIKFLRFIKSLFVG